VLPHSDTAFLAAIEPPLLAGDLPVLLARLRADWSPERLAELLASPLSAVAAAAATCLGLSGSMKHCQRLVSALGHTDDQVAAAAENALWSIWMRAGSEDACARLRTAVRQLERGEIEAALVTLRDLIAAEGSMAEAYHQQAIALHSLEQYQEAEAAYQQAVALNAYHFAAVAGLGHIRAQGGDWAGALGYYRRALRINPRLTDIREIVPQLETAIRKRVVA
jgi:tetratricopeptide (TPR) repeat protein